MRSRDGSGPLLQVLLALVALCASTVADEYLIGYRVVVKDAVVANERFFVSKAMTKCRGEVQKPLRLIVDDPNEKLATILQKSDDFFYRYLLKQRLHVKDYTKTSSASTSELTTLTFPTHCFKVDFKGNLVTIALIKE